MLYYLSFALPSLLIKNLVVLGIEEEEDGQMRFNYNGLFHVSFLECRPCPAGMEPALGFEYKWWNVLPGNMKTSCFNVGNSKCDGMNGEFRISLLGVFG